MSRKVRSLSALLLVVSTTFVATGCAGDEVLPASPSITSAATSASDEYWLSALRSAPGLTEADRPAVAVIREIALAEYGKVIVECMHEAGYTDARLTEDGEGYMITTRSEAEAKNVALAEYVCRSQYPIDPKFAAPLSDAQLRAVYAYFTGPLALCLREQGYEIDPPPSWASFVQEYEAGGGWSPLIDVQQSLADPMEATRLATICQALPGDLH